ncbi:DUF3575 domain-containing protein [uncultured Flavobacterium sp.]|jgi:hypothetical protein|uniref:DUF3575 domain-containing protein n=1 Tax=uncultured Flavobacterium sp. TaxID=165435 RepID=UPI0030CA2487
MRKLNFTFFTIACLLVNTQTFAQQQKAIKISPFTFLKGQPVMIHYEHNVFKSFTMGVGVAPIMWGPIIGSLLYPPTKFNTGIAIDPEIRWYAKNDKVMDGFFVGLYNSNRFSSWEGTSTEEIFDLYSEINEWDIKNRKIIVGLQLGVQRLIGDHFSVDFYSGIGFNSNLTTATRKIDQYTETTPSGGVNLRLNVALGWQF